MGERFGKRVGDHIKFHCGDRVRDVNDERHEGVVESIRWGYEAKIKWDNGWFGYVRLRDLEKVK
jgi:hypothetical protein